MTVYRRYPAGVNASPPIALDPYWTAGWVNSQTQRLASTPADQVDGLNSHATSGSGMAAGAPRLARHYVGTVPRSGTLQGYVTHMMVGREQGDNNDAYPMLRVRVFSQDGVTLRGVLFSGVPAGTGTEFPVSTTNHGAAASRLVGGKLNKLENIQPTDILVVEPGCVRLGTGTSGNYVYEGSTGASAVDFPTEGITATQGGRTWIDFDLRDAPGPPTDLVAVGGAGSIALSWTPPTSEDAATSYDVQVVGGALEDAGNVTSYTVGSLAPETTFTVQVRARNEWGVSSWVTAEATTLSGADYRAVVRVGSHTWDVSAGDPPTLGPILPLSFGWAVPEDSLGFPAQPDPDVCNLELVTADGSTLSGVDIGTTMRVSIYTTLGPLARPLATFRGRVADMEAAPHPHGLSWRLLGVGYDADPGSRQVGTGPWPQESGDARAARVMAEAGYPGWTAPAIGSEFEAREPAPVMAREAMLDVANQAVSAEAGGWGPSRRVLVHPVTDDNGDLTPAAPFRGAEVVRRTDALDFVSAGLVNRNTTWRRTKLLDATWVRMDHPGGPTTYGDTRGSAYPPQSVQVTNPRELADLILDTTPGYRWLTGQPLRLELWADDGPLTSLVSQWFYRDPDSPAFPWSGRAVIVEGIAKTPDGSSRYAGMLAAATLRLEPSPVGGRLVVEFRLRPEIPAHSTVTMRWMDEPLLGTWAEEDAADPTGTWWDYYTRPRP